MRAVNYTIPFNMLTNMPHEESALKNAVLCKFKDDATVLNVSRNGMDQELILTVGHPDFDDIEEGFMFPEYDSALHGPKDDDLPDVDSARRLLRYSITPNFILSALSSGSWFKFDAGLMPDDAEVLGVNASWESECIHIMVRSSEFETVPEGEIIPLAESMLITIKEPDNAED